MTSTGNCGSSHQLSEQVPVASVPTERAAKHCLLGGGAGAWSGSSQGVELTPPPAPTSAPGGRGTWTGGSAGTVCVEVTSAGRAAQSSPFSQSALRPPQAKPLAIQAACVTNGHGGFVSERCGGMLCSDTLQSSRRMDSLPPENFASAVGAQPGPTEAETEAGATTRMFDSQMSG